MESIMKKILYILIISIIIFLSSCQIINRAENETEINITNTTESIINQTTVESDTIEITTKNIETETESITTPEPIDASPYTLDEIKSIFNESRKLFEEVKDIFAKLEYHIYIYNTLGEEKYFGPNFTGTGIFNIRDEIYSITELDEYKPIVELCNKYDIWYIMGYDYYIDEKQTKIGFGIIFSLLSQRGYEQRIVYSETSGVSEDVKDEYLEGRMKLDDNWYYERVMHPD